jgi:3-hydroxy-3-methylglutaryl CoA synthase
VKQRWQILKSKVKRRFLMAGITSYGAYIPLWRISRDTIAAAWGRRSTGGERSMANNDEDTVTMATEAVFDCLNGVNREDVDGLYFASTTPPFREKECATMVGAVVDLKSEIVTADYGNSLRAGTSAFRAALDAVGNGSAKSILVTASDCRIGYPRSDYEQQFGDAGVAFLIGNTNPAVVVEGSKSISNEMYDVWRLDSDTYVQDWEGRFILDEGYTKVMKEAISGFMKEQNLSPQDITKAIFYGPAVRAQQGLARSLGFDAKTQLQDLMIGDVGVCGCAHALLMLVAALEEAKPGDRLLLASYGNGSDVFLLRVTDEIEKMRNGRRGVKGFLNSKKAFSNYVRFLSYRGLVEPQPGEAFKLANIAASQMWRDRKSVIRCHASRCKNCGVITFPIQRVCYNCMSKDNYEEVRLSDKKGKIFTYTLDQLAGRSDDPVIPQVTFESELGATCYLMMTDCDPNEVHIDMPVELTFRRIYEGGRMYNYFWKCRPIR